VRFSLRFVFFCILLASLLFAVLGGMLRESNRPDGGRPWVYLTLTIAMPIGLVVVLSMARAVGNWFDRRRSD